MVARRIEDRTELFATLAEARLVVYISVDWAVQERDSRRVFADYVDAITTLVPDLEISFRVLAEGCEGELEWFRRLELPGQTATGYGAVIWLGRGVVLDWVENAAACGVENLIERTREFWWDG